MSPRNKEEREWKDLLHKKKAYIKRRDEEAESLRALRDFLRHQDEDDEFSRACGTHPETDD